MKKILLIFLINALYFSCFAQKGEIWPLTHRQDFDVDEKVQVTKTYEKISVCQFFMFINNNEFIHVTDGMTSLYKIIKRDLSKPNEPMYTVVSESAKTYTYIFNFESKKVFAYSTQGFLIEWTCLDRYITPVFDNLNR